MAALTVWGGYAERVRVAERNAIRVPDDVDPAVIASLVFPHMTAYQQLPRTARAASGETLRRGGRLVLFGHCSTLSNGRRSRRGGIRDDLLTLIGLLREERIRPIVAKRLPLTDARRAHEMLGRSAPKGKLVLVP